MNEPIPARAPGPHPTAEQLYAARRGPRTAEAERHLAHAAACALCSEELLRQEAFDAPEPMREQDLEAAWARFGKPPADRRSRQRSPLLALAAALAFTVLGLGVWKASHPPAPDDVTRSGGPATGTWSPEGILAAPPEEFVFPDPGGEPRRVTVYDATQSYVWTSPPAAGRAPFPESERRRLQPGVEYLWTVLGDEGSAPARSFQIRP
jgi:hypothetical protein